MWSAGIKGFDEVMTNLNREIEKIKGGTMKGLLESAEIIRKDMDKTPPTIPVDTGNLRQSWFVTTPKGVESSKPSFKQNTKYKGNMDAEYQNAVQEAQAIIQSAATKDSPFIVMGFAANYAAPVHEMELRHANVDWNRASSGSKFFEYAVKRNAKIVLQTIQKNAEIR